MAISVNRLRAVLALVFAAVLLSPVAASGVRAGAGPDSIHLRATYEVNATLKWAKAKLIVSSTAHVTNTSNDSVGALSFNLVPARIGALVLQGVSVNGNPATASISDQTIVVNLPGSLAPGAEADVTINYKATFKGNGNDKNWLFAKLQGYATAYRWIPWLSRPTQFNRSNIGDPFATSVSPRVDVTITSDRALGIGATGRRTSVNGLTQTFVATNVRDFNFVASPNYTLRTETIRGITVNFWYRDIKIDKIQTWTRNAIGRFTDLVGAYPYDTLTVAENHATSAMESPQMIWMPWNTPSWNIPFLTTHELGHQWFYGVVGNSQPHQPFVDEGLTEFITRDFVGFRNPQCANDRLDKSIYEYSGSCYYETVYVGSSRYIDNYRDTVGNSNFWNALQAYYQNFKFERVTIRQFWEFMDARTGYGGSHAERFPSIY